MKTAKAMVARAVSWLGCKESDGSHKAIIDIYNANEPLARGYRMRYTDPWCAAFVSAVAVKAGCADIVPAECSCSEMVKQLQKMGIWVENDGHVPAPGDILFYDWEDCGTGDDRGSADHVGIVEKVTGNVITVIEGNCQNAVRRRTLPVGGRYILGYGVPKYDAVPEKSIDELAREVIAGKYGNGALRKANLGDRYEAVQARVNEILLGKSEEKTVDQLAREVIAGKHGNGAARKKSLGSRYAEVEARVNAILREDGK